MRMVEPAYGTIAGCALVALHSNHLFPVGGAGCRIALAYIVGVLLALGPFGHVIVTVLHLLFAPFRVGNRLEALAGIIVISTAGSG